MAEKAKRVTRSNEEFLPWLRAVLFTAIAVLALWAVPTFNGQPFYPEPILAAIALGCGVLGFMAPGIGVIALVVAVSLPLAPSNPLIAAALLLLGLSAAQFLAQGRGRVFLLIALAVVATGIRAEWAIPAIAGILLGAGEGATVAVIAAVLVETVGLVMGKPSLGATVTGGVTALIKDVAGLPGSSLTFQWAAKVIGTVNPGTTLAAAAKAHDLLLLIAQPAVWGVGAAVSGLLASRSGDRRTVMTIAAAAGALVTAVGAGSLVFFMAGPQGAGPIVAPLTIAITAVVSLIVATGYAWLTETLFPVVEHKRRSTMEDEDADVDELLRVLASTEEQLATKHTTTATVLITDMKSFSKMTQDEGSLTTAKAIQKHRDLLMPIVEKLGGHGRATGGDGLVAAFADDRTAVSAAASMQRALAADNAKRRGPELLVRIGLARGEVVLDRNGRPFIGDALNVAARVMGLADGGQIFVSQAVAAGADEPVAELGAYDLKNIAGAVTIFEVLWAPDQQPCAPAIAQAATAPPVPPAPTPPAAATEGQGATEGPAPADQPTDPDAVAGADDTTPPA